MPTSLDRRATSGVWSGAAVHRFDPLNRSFRLLGLTGRSAREYIPDMSSTIAGSGAPLDSGEIPAAVVEALSAARFIDIHTHLFMPSLGENGLWGIDNLITYHYLEAELFRSSNIAPREYFALSKSEKADAIWRALFVENAPVSEATRGVVAVLNAFGLPTQGSDLSEIREARKFFAAQSPDAHIDRVLQLAGVSEVVMTNDPLDPNEAPLWERGVPPDPRFHPVLRLDRILNKWADHWRILEAARFTMCGASWPSGTTACIRSTWPSPSPTRSSSRRIPCAAACSPRPCCPPAASSISRSRSWSASATW
jgi:hypothetical protein